MLIQQSAARPISFFFDEASPTLTNLYLSKAGGAQTDILSGVTVTNRGNGQVAITLANSHVDTLGEALLIAVTATESLPQRINVVLFDPYLAIPTAAQISNKIAIDREDDENGWDVTNVKLDGATSLKIATDIDNDANGWAGAKGGIAAAVWDIATASLTTVGSIGKYIVDTFTLFGEAFTLLFQRVTGVVETKTEADTRQTALLTAIGDVEGGGGDATEAKQDQIIAAIGTAAIVRVPVVRPGYVEVIEGATYDGTFAPKIYWTVTTDYTTADSIDLTIWRPNEDGTRTIMKTIAGVATTATNVEIADFVATFDADLSFAGKPMQETLQFAIIAIDGDDEYVIDSGDFVVIERRR
jgi:hypothetical protein